jgi:hypothetical protein
VDLDSYLEFELGEEPNDFNGVQHRAAAGKILQVRQTNLRSNSFGIAPITIRTTFTHQKVLAVPGAKSARVCVLGPPHDIDKIDDVDPIGDETFGGDRALAVRRGVGEDTLSNVSPFSRRHWIPLGQAVSDPKWGTFFSTHYGVEDGVPDSTDDGKEIPPSAAWRCMVADYAADAEASCRPIRACRRVRRRSCQLAEIPAARERNSNVFRSDH